MFTLKIVKSILECRLLQMYLALERLVKALMKDNEKKKKKCNTFVKIFILSNSLNN